MRAQFLLCLPTAGNPSKLRHCFITSLLYINVKIKLTNTVQYSVPSIAEINMKSSGSGYEWHFKINSFKNNQKKDIRK